MLFPIFFQERIRNKRRRAAKTKKRRRIVSRGTSCDGTWVAEKFWRVETITSGQLESVSVRFRGRGSKTKKGQKNEGFSSAKNKSRVTIMDIASLWLFFPDSMNLIFKHEPIIHDQMVLFVLIVNYSYISSSWFYSTASFIRLILITIVW